MKKKTDSPQNNKESVTQKTGQKSTSGSVRINTGRFKTQFNGHGNTYDSKGGGPNLTTPDLSLTPRQLLDRHSRGMALTIPIKEGQYFEDEEVPNFTDITERHEFYQEQKETIEKIQDNIKTEIAEAKTKKEAAEKQKEIEIYEKVKEQLKAQQNI